MTRHEHRETISLDGLWSFAFLENGALDEAAPTFDAYDDVMPVPAVFDLLPRYLRKRGLAYYRREIRLAAQCPNAVLRVGGLGLSARFWIDGREVGTADMPYNPYTFLTGALDAGLHTVVVAVDNRLSRSTPFFKPNYDFYAFGGIYRPMWLEALPAGATVDRIQVRTVSLAERRVSLRILFHDTGTPLPQTVRVQFDTEKEPRTLTVAPEKTALAPGGEATLELTVPEARVWSLARPHLHEVWCEVPESGDTIRETFGIRTIEGRDGKFLLNGEPVRLLGFNRHESHAELGPALPEAIMLTDLQHLRELGCNFVRGSHYPQDQRFLDLCDRLGFLVWEEGLGWGDEPPVLGNPVFIEGQTAQMRRMVRESVNHPSVIFWAFLNEFNSGSDEGVALCRRLVDTIREEDTSRLVTFACNRGGNDRCIGMVDVAAYNTYPGWCGDDPIDDQPEDKIRPNRDNILAHILRVRKEGAPIMVSEMGACGVYGFRDDAAAQWTEEFQVRYMREIYKAVLERPEIQGFTVWQLNDCYSYHRRGASLRVKAFAQNLAGAFDIYRRRKLGGHPGAYFPEVAPKD